MAAGGPGDHWRTDVLQWDLPAFGEPADSLIKEISTLGGSARLEDDTVLGQRLWELWPRWGRVDRAALAEVSDDLETLRDDLLAEARARGWEVD